MKKNLIYFMYLKDGTINKFAEVNIKLLKRYLSIFDGQKIIKIAVDNIDLDYSHLVKIFSEFQNCDVKIVKNNPETCEGETFIDSIKELNNEDSITFYSHAKGVSVNYGENDKFQSHKMWMFSMYFFNLEPDFLNEISFQLQNGKSFSGILRKEISCPPWVPTDWHYSGTFYWFKTKDVLTKAGWDSIEKNRFTPESFPGYIVPLDKSHYNLISLPQNYDTYHYDFWQYIINPKTIGYELYNRYMKIYNEYID